MVNDYLVIFNNPDSPELGEGSRHQTAVWTHLPKAGGIDRLRVIFLTEVQVMHVESASRNTDTFCNLIVLLQP